ncbi:MAG: glutamate--tRNA ligase [Planctomycetota bacterium]
MSEDTAAEVITRFAPSPTGHLHIGGARTALFCWAMARRHKGTFILRIEDTDRKRSSFDAVRGIVEDLAWLGIDWDEGPELAVGGRALGGDPRVVGPFFQSDRGDVYDAKFAELIEAGLACPAFDTPEELGAMRKEAEAAKRSFVYRRPAGYDLAAALERAKTEPHVLRFNMPAEGVTVSDEVLGDVTFPYEELDDLVIRKTDGMPTYHFAVVVDDALMGVNHVLRGQEHLNNTPKHVALQRALGLETPRYAHMPLIFNIDGTKMSKRDKDKAAKKAVRDAKLDSSPVASVDEAEFKKWLKDKSRQLSREQVSDVAAALNVTLPEIDVEDFRAAGYLPEVLNNFLSLLGWNPGGDVERFDMDFLLEKFGTDRIGKSNAKFDREKLIAFNADTIQHHMSDDGFAQRWLEWAVRFDETLAAWAHADESRWLIAAKAARPRAKTLADAAAAIAFARIGDDAFDYDSKAVKKGLLKGEPNGLSVLPDLRSLLEMTEPWSPESIDTAIHDFAGARKLGLGKVAAPLRVAITGTAVSPPLGETLALLKRESALARISRCTAAHAGP